MKIYSFKMRKQKEQKFVKLLKICLRCDINIEDKDKLLLFKNFKQ